jgi:hypothetical protein
VLRELLEVLQPLLNQPAIAEQLVELSTREAAVSAREQALAAREGRINQALAALGQPL